MISGVSRFFGLFLAVFIVTCLTSRSSHALDSGLAEALERHAAGMETVTQENYYDVYQQYLQRSWELTRALYDANAPAERLALAERTIALLGKTGYPDIDEIQKFEFERFVALYQLGRGTDAEELLGDELRGQFLRNYLPPKMQDITARAAFREGENALNNGQLESAPWVYSAAARDYLKLEGANSPSRIVAISRSALSSAMSGRYKQARQELDRVFNEGGLSADAARALADVAGKVALMAGDAEKAAGYFDQALDAEQRKTPPHNGGAFGTRLAAASVYLRTGQIGKAAEIVDTLYSATSSLEMLARIHRLAGRIALAANDPTAAKASLLQALKSIDQDPLQNFKLRGALLADYAAVGGGADLDDPFPMAGSAAESILNRAERMIAERRYQSALDNLAPLTAAGDLSPSQQGRLVLALAHANFFLEGPTGAGEEGLVQTLSDAAIFPDSARAGMLYLAFETAMHNRSLERAGDFLGRLEEIVFAHRPEGHPDLFVIASLNAALYYGQYATDNFYDETGQTITAEFGKVVVASARDFGLVSPVTAQVLKPQLTYGIRHGNDWVEDVGEGNAAVLHTDLVSGLLEMTGHPTDADLLRLKYERALSILASLADSYGEQRDVRLRSGLAALDEIIAAQQDRGASNLAEEASYLRSLFNGATPRDTDTILAKKAMEARGFDPKAILAILFGAPTQEDPRMARILKRLIEAEYGIDREDGGWGGYAESLMADLAFDPETGTHFGFAPFDTQSYPEGKSVLERSALISDCFRNGRPWSDCTLTYSPLGGGKLTAEEAAECRDQALQAERHSVIYARYEADAVAADAQEKYDLASSIRQQRDEELEQAGLSSIFPSCWVYEKGPGVIDPAAAKAKPQIDLTRVILKKKKKAE
ncbi:tetratricopeptide repeat protein [Hwanghaeella sp.]|uniref:tetratricopeptide repeat protein n=1 Tax=Hwanghaeella sp. TaxID=2605943 RepID=UPI003CCBCE81